ncbi:MAG: hypothetical protein ACTSPV_16665 [Candidatus Hodarchaeales archaeon]
MDKKQIKQFKEIVKIEERSYDFNDLIFNWIEEEDLQEIKNIDDLRDFLYELNDDREITNAEVIYYHKAIKYLAENDSSLRESLDIAEEMGYSDLSKINSELLASLHLTQQNEEDYNEFVEDVIIECERFLK